MPISLTSIQARREDANGRPLARFVISRAIKNTRLSSDVTAALQNYKIPVLQASTTQRVIYPSSAAEGKTVFQMEPYGSSALEIESITQEIMEVLHVTEHQTTRRFSDAKKAALEEAGREDQVRLNLDISQSLHRQIKLRAIHEGHGATLKSVVLSAPHENLRRHSDESLM